MNYRIEPKYWESTLIDFTARNVGRVTALEADDEVFGAYAQASGLRLRGLTYDARRDEVEIMLDRVISPREHLTHKVPAVSGIDVERVGAGDAAIRFAHGSNQTVLRFTDEPS